MATLKTGVVLDIRSDVARAARDIGRFTDREMQAATVMAINATGRAAIKDLQDEMRSVFRAPVAWTLNAFNLRPARKPSSGWGKGPPLTGSIEPKDFAGKGTPAWKYLTPEIEGGPRGIKRFERRIDFKLGLGDRAMVPGEGASTTAGGAISNAQLVQIIAGLGALDPIQNDKGFKAKRRAATKARPKYFVGRDKDGNPTAIYKVAGPGDVVPVLVFTRQRPTYTARFPYMETVNKSIGTHMPLELRRAMAKILATRR